MMDTQTGAAGHDYIANFASRHSESLLLHSAVATFALRMRLTGRDSPAGWELSLLRVTFCLAK
jgi:hypothetical protein